VDRRIEMKMKVEASVVFRFQSSSLAETGALSMRSWDEPMRETTSRSSTSA
jgi:hypothetical protein